MKLLLALIISLIIILIAEKNIRKHAPIWYCGSFLLSLLCLLLPSSTPAWLSTFVTNFISRGTFATALFILVMYARVLPPKSRIFRTLMSLRAPIAIMASFMILIHNGSYFIYYYNNASKRNIYMTIPEIIAATCTAMMLLLLIPLTITSFTSIRKKMKGVTWKKLQRLSYIFYGLIYLHVTCLFSMQIANGNQSYQLELAIYTAIFGIYLVSRVALYLKNKQKISASKHLRNIGIPTIVAFSVFIFVFQIPKSNRPISIETEPVALAESETQGITESQTDSVACIYQDGEWEGTSFGYNDDITVSVTIESGVITNISVLSYEDDDPYFSWAKKEILPYIITNQSTDIDTVSGATFSSKGLINAVRDALSKAIQ